MFNDKKIYNGIVGQPSPDLRNFAMDKNKNNIPDVVECNIKPIKRV